MKKLLRNPGELPEKLSIQDQNLLLSLPYLGHLAALTRSHLIGDYPSGLTKEQTTETMDPKNKRAARLSPPMKFRACRSCEAASAFSKIWSRCLPFASTCWS